MYAVLKALSLLSGAKKYHKDSTPKLTDTILSIKVSDVNAYFGKSDEFCISAKKKPHPHQGDAVFLCGNAKFVAFSEISIDIRGLY